MNSPIKTNLEPVRTATVITILGQITEGRDGETYKVEVLEDDTDKTVTGYAKLTQDPRKLIAELTTSQLGRALGLNIPRPYLGILDTSLLPKSAESEFMGMGKIVCFISQQAGAHSVSLERAFSEGSMAARKDISRQFDLNGTVVLDELVANTDRHLGNLVYSPDSRKVWLIDHGRALTGSYWQLWGLENPAIAVRNELADNNVQSWDERIRREILDRAHQITNDCALLPLEDIDCDHYFSKIDAGTDREQIINFLKERIHHTVPLLCNRLHIGHLSLQPPNLS